MLSAHELSPHFTTVEGFCRPNWEAIADRITKGYPEEQWQECYEIAARYWVEKLREGLGGSYLVVETRNFLLLSMLPKKDAEELGRFCEKVRETLLTRLEGVAYDWGYGIHVILLFDDGNDYYRYICHFYPEGEHPMSGGIWITAGGYGHCAIPASSEGYLRTSLVHELTHCFCHDRRLPVWLNEAMAMRMEGWICGRNHIRLDRELYRTHCEFWDEETIQQFWSGDLWGLAGEGFELAYVLSAILWRKIEVDLDSADSIMLGFLREAKWEDAGQAAFRKWFDLDLGDLVEDFLGEGQWNPRPEKWRRNEDEATPA